MTFVDALPRPNIWFYTIQYYHSYYNLSYHYKLSSTGYRTWKFVLYPSPESYIHVNLHKSHHYKTQHNNKHCLIQTN
jgi:hypothetical protein